MLEESDAMKKAREIAWSVLPDPPEGKTYLLGKVWAESFRRELLVPQIASALAEREESWKLAVKELARVSALNEKLVEALGKISSQRVLEVNGGPEDMSQAEKNFCAAFGACIVLAQEALALAKEATP